MTPQEKLKEIEKELDTVGPMDGGLDERHVKWLIARVEQLERAVISISKGYECSACSCNCHNVAVKALSTGPKPE